MTPMSDVDILAKKTDEIRRLRLHRAGLIIVVGFLVAVLSLMGILSRIKDLEPKPNFDVIRNAKVVVPKTVVAGKDFDYHSTGEKLIDVGANIKVQLNCLVDGVENIVQVGEYTSHLPKGKYDLRQKMVIPVSQRILPSRSCHLRLTSLYVFYQNDTGGDLRQIDIPVVVRSNNFKLEVPDDYLDLLEQQNAITLDSVTSTPVTSPVIASVPKAKEETTAQRTTQPPITRRSTTPPSNPDPDPTPNKPDPEPVCNPVISLPILGPLYCTYK